MDSNEDIGQKIAPNAIWATIGKISAIASLLIALFSVYSLAFPDKPSIHAKCQLIQNYPKPTLPTPAESKTSPETQKSETTKSDIQKQESVTTYHIRSKDVFLGPINEHCLKCEISNTGKQEAKDVVIDLPFKIELAMLDEQAVNYEEKAKSSINIGSIRPGKNINVLAWNSFLFYETKSSDKYSISFSGGTGTIEFPVTSFGFVGKIASTLNFVFKNSFLLALTVAGSAYLLFIFTSPFLRKFLAKKE